MDTLKAAIAFERYRLQIVGAWPDCDFKQETLSGVESSLQRLLAERQSEQDGKSGNGCGSAHFDTLHWRID